MKDNITIVFRVRVQKHPHDQAPIAKIIVKGFSEYPPPTGHEQFSPY